MRERSKGRVQTKRDTLALQVGVGHGLTTSFRKKNVVQKPNNQPRIGGTVETGCQVGQGSPRAVAPSEEERSFYLTGNNTS
jgi:hypothetical protein